MVNRIWFRVHFCITGISPTLLWYIICDSINRLGDLDPDLLTSK